MLLDEVRDDLAEEIKPLVPKSASPRTIARVANSHILKVLDERYYHAKKVLDAFIERSNKRDQRALLKVRMDIVYIAELRAWTIMDAGRVR